VANIARKETSAIARNIILFSLLVEEEEEPLLLLLLLLFDEKEKTPPIVVLFFFFFFSIARRFCANDVRVYLSGFFLPFFSREMLQKYKRRERERERCLCDAEARRPQPRQPLARFLLPLLLLANSPFSSRAKQNNDAPLSRRRRRIRFSLSGIFFFEEISPGKRKWIKRLPFLPLLLRVLTRRRRPRLRPKTR
jgi:hypothetical protein